uniref:Myotubularin-related protein 9 n=1 Tax=Phallusia mammillata TaxID=59560 RepID=A0A6F9DM42_9ASCI|nr:myotubularin-related protein 9 [Phallusia mammillata]
MEFSEFIQTPKVEDAFLEVENGTVPVTACLTGHHLILYSHNGENKEYWILHKNVDSVEKRYSVEKNLLVLKCKDFTQHQITIPTADDATNIANSIETLSSLNNPALQYPFFHRPKFTFDEDGYDLFCTEHRFASLSKMSDQWRISNINLHFSVCNSYPSQVIVPKDISNEMIVKSAKFRYGGRFPILSYLHTNGRVVMRCGQPLTGQNQKRCKEDEKLINIVLGSTHRGYILDTRTTQAALQARSKGGGFETEFNYPQWRKFHNSLQKYSIQQESFVRIVEACQDRNASSDRWQSKLESSNWLSHVKDVLSAACLVAQCVDREGASVLVHGSEGTDSTLLVTSLTQVILDPYCRTIRGFLCLIDMEWVQAGHPFADRCFHGAQSNQRTRSEGPTFTLFLDCVHQLLQQFPLSFEFSALLLIHLHRHAYASGFGTFLCNNEMERRKFKVRTKTVSLWSYLLSVNVLPMFLNPLYQTRPGVIWPSVAPQSLKLWDGLFLKDIDPSPEVQRIVSESISYMEDLQNQISELTKEISLLEREEETTSPLLQNGQNQAIDCQNSA